MKLPLKKRVSLKLFQLYTKNEIKLHELSYLFWECTQRCNLSCVHCGSDCQKSSIHQDMPIKDFEKTLIEIKNSYDSSKIHIVITGGEALLRDDLEYAGKMITSLGFNYGLVTNGILLSQSRVDSLIKAGLTSITVSVDGLQKSHENMRGKGTFEPTIKSLQLIVKSGLINDVVTCVTKWNIGELEEIKNLLLKNGITKWRLFPITPIGRAKDNEHMILSNDDYSTLHQFIADTKKRGDIMIDFSCEGFLGKFENESRDGFHFCQAGISIGSVLIDGSISACPNINREFVQGNIYNDSFVDVWENRFKGFRNRRALLPDKCLHCKVVNYCKGGGMHLITPEKEILNCHFENIL